MQCGNTVINYSGVCEKFYCIVLLAFKRDKGILNFVILGALSADEPKCEISRRLGNCPEDEETVDPDSIIPSLCSIKNGGNISRNMTWKEVNDTITPEPGLQCLVLKTGKSEKRIYFASKCCVSRYQQWSYNVQNTIPNEHFNSSRRARFHTPSEGKKLV